MCIVVVDDEPELLQLVNDVLVSQGYEVLSFDHPEPASHVKETGEQPQLFIVDLMLPDMNGIALAKCLEDEGFDRTPKIAMSASRQLLRRAEESHLFQGTLDKPFDIDDLLACVQRHITS
jgi:DNA-binding response OmpR family regulator